MDAQREQANEEYYQFLMEVLQAISDDSSPWSVYPLLQANLDKLDNHLIAVLQTWAEAKLPEVNRAQAEFIASVIHNFSYFIHQFPLGNKAANIEISLVGYKICLTVFTRDSNSEIWARTQNNLGNAYRGRIKGDRGENLENALAASQRALSFFTKEAFPYDWAGTQYNLGAAYFNRIKGDRGENLENALAACQRALSVFTKEAFPTEWARTQHDLGGAYFNRIKGDRGENLELALAACQGALSVFTSSAFPTEWATTQNNLGNVYTDRIEGDQGENLENALAAYQRALSVYTKEAFPTDWAMTQYNLGLAYSKRIKGDRSENLENALAAFQRALSVYTKEAFPTEWAMTQDNLGNVYRDRIKGDRNKNLENALPAYRRALSVYTKEAFPTDWARTQHNLGAAYFNRIKGDRGENLEKALAAYQRALSVRTQEASPYDWAMTQDNLGNTYLNIIKGDRYENVENALAAFQRALSVFTEEAFPTDWARTQHNLGAAYCERIKGDRGENQKLALAAFQRALSVRTQEAFLSNWARTQYNLGTAYKNSIKGDRSENLEFALVAFQGALSVFKEESFPTDWARTQNNLGNAYLDRIKGKRGENVEKALAAFQRALSVFKEKSFLTDWAMTQNNLGNAYSDRIYGDKSENLENALAAFQQALLIYTQEEFPTYWARTQNNLGNVYCERIKGDRGKNLELALAAYQRTLSVYAQETFSYDWASTQNNLGNAYCDRIKGERTENIKEAIAYYRQALKIYKPQNLPIDCLRTGSNLGNLGFENSNWELAIEGYEMAIDAVETSRNWAVNDDRRQEILREAISAYANIVQAYINLGKIDKALEYVERSRSKRLVDLMASNDLYSDGEITPQVREKLQAYEFLQQQIDRERLPHQFESDRALQEVGRSYQVRAAFGPNSEKIAQLETEKQQVWQQLRSLDQVLAGGKEVNPPNLAAMQKLISSPTTAILSFYSTNNDTHIFILRQNQKPQLHTCTGEGWKTLQDWIVDNWLKPYVEDKTKTKWKNQMRDFLGKLSKRLQLYEFISQYLGDIEELILVPHLGLHQIPFAALPITNTGSPSNVKYLGDRFRLRTVPSCQVLEFCYKRPKLEADLKYGTVEDATEDLPLAAFECEQIVQMYDIPESLRLKGRQSATVENYRQLVKQVQVLHSGHHAQSRIDNPLESVLVLGNGYITLGELMTPGWRLPNLSDVFLSCCETNLGWMEITDDLLTISTGFLCAGARSVVNTLWAVDDLATALFSIFYYQFRQQGYNRPTALREAQVALRTFSGKEFPQGYKDDIEGLLAQKLREVYKPRKQAKKERDKHPADSEAYQQWHEEYERLNKLEKKLKKAQNRLNDVCKQSFPFESPYYWAAFTCQGLP